MNWSRFWRFLQPSAAFFSLFLLAAAGAEGLARVFAPLPPPKPTIYDPLAASVRPPNYDQTEPYSIHTDAFGFQGDPMSLSRAPNTFRIIVVGGSVVEGLLVSIEDRFPMVLKRILQERGEGSRRIEVAFAGSGGSGSVHSLQVIATRALHLRPDLILQLDAGEMFWPLAEDYEPTGMYLSKRVRDVSAFITIDSRLRTWIQTLKWARSVRTASPEQALAAAVAQRRSIAVTNLPDEELPSYEEAAANIHRTALLCRDAGVAYGIMTAPWIYKDQQPAEEDERIWLTYRRSLKMNFSTSAARRIANKYNDALREQVRKDQLIFIDLAALIPRDLTHLWDDVHPTKIGHRRIANEIARELDRRGVLTNP